MNQFEHVVLPLLPSGIPGLDLVLGGGVPELSFNLITGASGTGKTTLAHQIMFANASEARPALYFTVLGEAPLKMLRYQQQLDFFDADKLERSVYFSDLSARVLEHGLDAVLERIVEQVRQVQPRIIVVDSFQAVIRTLAGRDHDHNELQSFVQRLAVYLTTSEATTFLVGEQLEHDPARSTVLTIADGIFVLQQSTDGNTIVRKLQVFKSRGVAATPGLHTFRITRSGLQVFPRISQLGQEQDRVRSTHRIASGSEGLDELLGGGIPAGDALLVSGPSGAGKSLLATQFIAAGLRNGEPGVIVIFEEHPAAYLRRASRFGLDLEQLERAGQLKIIYRRPLDLSPDETLHEIRVAVEQIGASRVVIDSLSGFELALASTFRLDFREALYSLVGSLTGMGITVLMTMELTESPHDLRFSPYVISFLADDIILLRYVELGGKLHTRLMVVKMRNSAHSRELRACEVTAQGLIVRDTLQPSERVQPLVAGLSGWAESARYPGLTQEEIVVLQALVELEEVPAELIAQRTGILVGVVLTRALDRLISLNYASRVEHERASATYRPVAHMLR